jgi:hypothetical protein
MTERARAPRRPSPGWVVGGASAAFVAVLFLLALQVRAGRDAALGAGTPVAAVPEPPRPVVVRRIVRTTVVTHVVRARAATAGRATATPVGAPAATGGPAPAAATRAPVAPASAPAPAPVTTQAS